MKIAMAALAGLLLAFAAGCASERADRRDVSYPQHERWWK